MLFELRRECLPLFRDVFATFGGRHRVDVPIPRETYCGSDVVAYDRLSTKVPTTVRTGQRATPENVSQRRAMVQSPAPLRVRILTDNVVQHQGQ